MVERGIGDNWAARRRVLGADLVNNIQQEVERAKGSQVDRSMKAVYSYNIADYNQELLRNYKGKRRKERSCGQ
jgi:hypothetical protein